jgi:hypothetical protein
MDTLKILAQTSPIANTLTACYTVPAATSTVISSIIVCNTNSTAQTFRISLAIGGASDATSQYIYYDLPIAGNDTFVATMGVTLATTDVVRVQANSTLVNFVLTGDQLT